MRLPRLITLGFGLFLTLFAGWLLTHDDTPSSSRLALRPLGEPDSGAPSLSGLARTADAATSAQRAASSASDPMATRAGERAPAATPLRVRVLDERAQPIGAARLFVLEQAAGRAPAQPAAQTNAQGEGLLAILEPKAASLGVAADGYRARVETVHRIETELDGTLVLERGARVWGEVVEASGQAVVGARVWCVPCGGESAWPAAGPFCADQSAFGAQTTSDAQGRFSLEGLDPQRALRIRVQAPGLWREQGAWPTVIPAAQVEALRLVMEPYGRVGVAVVDAESGEPVQGLRLGTRYLGGIRPTVAPLEQPAVRLHPQAGVITFLSFSQAQGPVDASAARLVLHLEAPGYQRREVTIAVQLGQESQERVALSLEAGTSLRSVRFTAEFEGGAPYDGLLAVNLGRVSAPVEFKGGRAVNALRLPRGEVMVSASGWGHQGVFWGEAAAPTALRILPEDGEQAVALRLRGARVRLSVHTPTGERVRDFALGFESAEQPLVLQPDWTLRARAAAEQEDFGWQGPLEIWLPPGSIRLVLRNDTLGQGQHELTLPADGSSHDADIAIDVAQLPAPVDPALLRAR